MTKLIALIAIAALVLLIGPIAASVFGRVFFGSAGEDASAAGWVVVALIAILACVYVFRIIRDDEQGNATSASRRVIGLLVSVPFVLVAVCLSLAFWAMMAWLLWRIGVSIFTLSLPQASPEPSRELARGIAALHPVLSIPLVSLWLIGSVLTGYAFSKNLREWTGKFLFPVRAALGGGTFGKGGSASFAGLLEEWRSRYRVGDILLGRSLYSPRWRVGWRDDRGLLTLASTRSGKGRSAIIPNLLTWPGSALVIDPKGTNAAVTAARRGHGGGRVTAFLGQEVFVLDPFRIVPGAAPASFNPLGHIDLEAATVREDIDAIADALIVQGAERDAHWDESAKAIIAGLIAHLLMRAREAGGTATLLDVRAALRQDAAALDKLFGQMSRNFEAGGLAASAAATFGNAGPRERGSFFTTIMRNTAWLDSVAMQRVLGGSENAINISALKATPTTIYVVLPPELLDAHSRFMRLVVNLALQAASKGGKGQFETLFILDEFFALGNLKMIEKAAGMLAGYGVRLWPIVQNITQLHENYPKNWEAFFSGAGAVQAFGVNELATGDYLVRRLGKRALQDGLRKEIFNLREVDEIGRDTSRESGRQIIFRAGAVPFLLGRLDYDRVFPKNWYNPDPDFAGGRGAPPPPPPDIPPGDPTIAEERFRNRPEIVESKAIDHGQALADAWERKKAARRTEPSPGDENPPARPPRKIAEKARSGSPAAEPDAGLEGDALEELDAMIGLEAVKKEARSVIAQVRMNKKRKEAGLKAVPVARHMVFTGNPGTGKTTVARIIGDVYRQNGLLESGHLLEVERADIIGKYVGHTAPLMRAKCEQALDGVLFIDEAYALAPREQGKDFGAEAVETLLKFMEDYRERIVVIAAGYRNEMQRFLDSNPGLKSRFGKVIDFPDYEPDELEAIFGKLCAENDYVLGAGADKKLTALMLALHAKKGRNFGNGRTVRNAFNACVERHNLRLDRVQSPDFAALTTLEPDDIIDDVGGLV